MTGDIDETGLNEMYFHLALAEDALKDNWMTEEERAIMMSLVARIKDFIRRIEDEGYVLTAADYDSIGLTTPGQAHVH